MKICSQCQEEKHESDFYPKMGRCKVCHKSKCYEWRKAHQDKVIATRLKWRAKPGSREKENAASRRWNANNVEHRKIVRQKRELKQLYGLTYEVYQEMLKAQNGCCAICGSKSKRALDVDHNHVTGNTRKLLCSPCNTLIGLAKENVETLQAAIAYLQSHRPRNLVLNQTVGS